MAKPIDSRVGIVGGGQLGKMLIESAQKWNIRFNVLDRPGAPAEKYAEVFINGSLTDVDHIRQLAEVSDILTYEIEHINADELLRLQKEGKKIVPSPEVLLTIQDKGIQKNFYAENKLPTAPFVLLNVDEIDSEIGKLTQLKGSQLVVKSCRGGYDGKGVVIVERDTITPAEMRKLFSGQILVEECITNAIELSVIVARSENGETATYPVVEMVFDPIKNLVDHLFAPARISKSVEATAVSISLAAVEAMNGIGIFAVELFMDDNNNLLINEIAPRPHNSGHHTIEACYTSQYEQLTRILLGLPLGSTELLKSAVMTNIIGPSDVNGDYNLNGVDELMNIPGAYLHWYNKQETRPGRKMGHFTILNDSLETALELSKEAAQRLRIVAV